MKSKLQKIENYIFLIPIIFVVIIKIPHLSLPYFWDEAWSYFPAVFKMYESGPGLLPGALPLWDAKGHPLFFFFLSSTWMKLVGTSVFWMHVLPLLISTGTLVAVYLVVKKHVNIWAAIVSVFLLSVQSLFLAQASMLLPEMFVTLLLLLSFDFYLQKKYWLFVLVATIMIMTKETSIVFVGGFLLFHLATYLKPGKESRSYILESIIMLIPIAVYGLFLILHKKTFGSFFFADHTGYIELTKSAILNKLQIATGIIFTRYGRNTILLAVVIALTIIFIRKEKIKNGNLLGLILTQTILFLLFSSLNFYTQRYMLSLMVLFVIAAGTLLNQAKFKKEILSWIVIVALFLIPGYYTFTKKTNGDSDLGYIETVKVHQQMVKFCEDQGWHDKNIASSFNMIFALRNPHLGYVSTEKGFSEVSDLTKFRDAEIYIEECTAWDHRLHLDTIKTENKLVQRFELKHAWGEIYTKEP